MTDGKSTILATEHLTGRKLHIHDGIAYTPDFAGWCWGCSQQCTGITAAWCPIHGDCKCDEAADGTPDLHTVGCPLHDPSSEHGEMANA